MPLTAAVDKAVDECINEGVLVDFLKNNKSVVKNMSIYEFNKELHEATIKEISREEGFQAGMEAGKIEGFSSGMEAGKIEGFTSGMEAGKIEGKIIAYYDIGCSMDDISLKMNIPVENVKDILDKELQSV